MIALDLHKTRIFKPALFVGVALLSGCATYAPEPLPERPALLVDAASLRTSVQSQDARSSHRFDPDDGFDATELAMAAVATSPMLRAARAQRGVAQAQLYAAGLLPDPQISTSLDIPQPDGPMLFTGYMAGVSSDILSGLITRGARISAATSALRQVDLDLLWQEWQVAQQARGLYADLYFLERKITAVATMLTRYRQRYTRSSQALARGDLTLDVTGTDLTAVLDAASQLSQLRQTLTQRHRDLASLLGLSPTATLQLTAPSAYRPLAEKQARQREADIIRRRPDLLALKAGYRSQEARVREAILGQFPAITAGVNRASDTSNVSTLGFSIGLNLPLFSGNRGAIATARATRAQLRAEYQQRLDSLPATIAQLLATQDILLKQKDLLDRYLPKLSGMVDKTRAAYERGDLDALTALNLENTLLNKRIESLDVRQQLWNTRYALETMLALPADEPAT